MCLAAAKLTCMVAVNKDLLPMTEKIGSSPLKHQAAYWLVKQLYKPKQPDCGIQSFYF